MKVFGTSYGYYRAALALILGVILIIWPEEAVNIIISVIGAGVLIFGGVSMLFSMKLKEAGEKPLITMNGLVSVVFGIVLILFPTFFAGIIMFLFGAILLLVGITECANLLSLRKLSSIPLALFIGPVFTTLCGIFIFFNPFSSTKWLFIFFGATLLVYAISSLITTKKVNSIFKEETKEEIKEKLIEDVDYEEVDD